MDPCKELCKEGDKIYRIFKDDVVEVTVIKITHHPHCAYKIDFDREAHFNRDFGKSLFKTREEAEQELQKRDKIAKKRKLLKDYERKLNEELNLGDHYIFK